MSPDGERVAFVASENGRQAIQLDEKPYSVYGPDWIVNWPLVFSETGRVVACRLSGPSRSCVGVNGKRGDEFDRVGPPVLSRDGSHVAYRAHFGERCFVVVDGIRGPEFDFMSDPAISADGRIVAYGAKEKEGWMLIAGTRQVAIEHKPSYVFLSADGTSVGYVRPDGAAQVRVVVNGTPGEAFNLVGLPVFSPDGARAAYAAEEGGTPYVVVGIRKFVTPGRESDPVFSADGRKVGYGARVGREIWWKILDAP